jgi:2,3-bisphosphoglycerate-dependent phosphoglycerate mutase
VELSILARHAESTYSLRKVMNGDPTVMVPLTETGRGEATALGRWLADRPVDLGVTSRFLRTRQTADIALKGRDVPRLILPELDDVRVGEFEGRDVADFRAWQRAHDVATQVPGGESRVEALARFVAGYRILLGRPEPSILAVTHGLPVTAVLLAIRGDDVPVTLEQVQVRPAEPHPITCGQLVAAIDRLEAWISERMPG